MEFLFKRTNNVKGLISWKVEYLRGPISYIQYIESMKFVTTARGAKSLIHQVIGTHSIEEQQMERYVGDVQTENVLEEQSLTFMIS